MMVSLSEVLLRIEVRNKAMLNVAVRGDAHPIYVAESPVDCGAEKEGSGDELEMGRNPGEVLRGWTRDEE
jgi:hypothetical protein